MASSGSEANVAVVRSHFDGINKQDWGAVLQTVHPEVKLHSSQARVIVRTILSEFLALTRYACIHTTQRKASAYI
jgi:hypothetical protein